MSNGDTVESSGIKIIGFFKKLFTPCYDAFLADAKIAELKSNIEKHKRASNEKQNNLTNALETIKKLEDELRDKDSFITGIKSARDSLSNEKVALLKELEKVKEKNKNLTERNKDLETATSGKVSSLKNENDAKLKENSKFIDKLSKLNEKLKTKVANLELEIKKLKKVDK